MMAPKMINRIKKAMAPLGLKEASNSASVTGVLDLACTNSVVSMKKKFCEGKSIRQTNP